MKLFMEHPKYKQHSIYILNGENTFSSLPKMIIGIWIWREREKKRGRESEGDRKDEKERDRGGRQTHRKIVVIKGNLKERQFRILCRLYAKFYVC